MAFVRLVLNFMVAGALLGILAVSVLAPRILEWFNTPVLPTAMCLCADVARQASTIITYQMRGCAVGAGLGAALGIAFAVMRRKSAVATTPPPAKA